MHLIVNDPAAIPALLTALLSGDCLAARDGPDAVAVGFPWLRQPRDARQARIELVFFARAWEAANPGLEISLGADP